MGLLVVNSDYERLYGVPEIPAGSIFYYIDGTYKVIPKEVTILTPSVMSEYEIEKEGLERVELDASVTNTQWTSTNDGIFKECASLKSFSAPGLTRICLGCFRGSSVEHVSIPAIKTIEEYAFDECRSLVSIDLPSTLITIDNYVFRNCSVLESIIIPNSVTTMGRSSGIYRGEVFYGCSNLESCTLSTGTTYIAKETFAYCGKLKSITIPANYTTIQQGAFYNCTSLKTIILEGNTPPTISEDSFSGNVTAFYVPNESVDSYKEANNWSTYADKIKPMSEYPST